MNAGDLTYITLSMSPVGGLFASIPWAVFKLDYPLWLIVLTCPPLTYVQVVVVDLAWTQLSRWGRVQRMLEGKRSPRIEKLLGSGGAFWPVLLATPVLGAWVVMAFMRFAHVRQRQVALPIFLALTGVTLAVAVACYLVPAWFN